MIAEDKDRLECLRLAVQTFTPRQNVTSDRVADAVVDAAKKFHAFVVSKDGEKNG